MSNVSLNLVVLSGIANEQFADGKSEPMVAVEYSRNGSIMGYGIFVTVSDEDGKPQEDAVLVEQFKEQFPTAEDVPSPFMLSLMGHAVLKRLDDSVEVRQLADLGSFELDDDE